VQPSRLEPQAVAKNQLRRHQRKRASTSGVKDKARGVLSSPTMHQLTADPVLASDARSRVQARSVFLAI
ncbi:MAG TPA: hypothetical protein VN831_09960, partial [Bradyrhizobium sp.]|nr:hypothetical protein [Bradyrhizobium sp.]